MNGVVYTRKVCTWIGPFYKIWPADQKKRDMASFFLFRQEFLVGGLFDTRVSFLKKITCTSLIFRSQVTIIIFQ
jgi:hypothetical protein